MFADRENKNLIRAGALVLICCLLLIYVPGGLASLRISLTPWSTSPAPTLKPEGAKT